MITVITSNYGTTHLLGHAAPGTNALIHASQLNIFSLLRKCPEWTGYLLY